MRGYHLADHRAGAGLCGRELRANAFARDENEKRKKRRKRSKHDISGNKMFVNEISRLDCNVQLNTIREFVHFGNNHRSFNRSQNSAVGFVNFFLIEFGIN